MKTMRNLTYALLLVSLLFLVGCPPYTVTITSPSDGENFAVGDEITFTGSARDFKDGELSGASLVWTSDQEGEIGKGKEFKKDDLSEGTHEIALTATNSEGEEGTATITITIGGATPPTTTTTTVEVDCDSYGGVVEGELGMFFRGAVECFSKDAVPIEGDIIYVSTDGSDDNAGNSINAPLKTIAKALCNATPGQTINILPGTYKESVILGLFGSDSAPITISGIDDGSGQPVILDGDRCLTMGIGIGESQNFIIENIEFQNYTDEGLYVFISSSVIIRDCVFTSNGFESIEPDFNGEGFGLIVVDTSDVTIENNEVFKNGPGPKAKAIMGTGIDTFAMSDSVIRDNSSHDNIGGGILVEDGVNVLVENNLIENNDLDATAEGWWDAGIWIDGGYGITARGNTIRNNLGPGIQVSDEDLQYYNDPKASYGYLVEDNIITGNYFGLYTFNFGQCPLPPTDILIWQNNTLENNVYEGTLDPENKLEEQLLCIEWPCGVMTACE